MTAARMTITAITAVISLTLTILVPLQRPDLAAGATPPQTAPTPQSVKGEVIIITDEFYVVKDAVGKGMVQVLISRATKVDGSIKMGDKVEAQLSADGYAVFVKKAGKEAQ